MIDIEPNKVVQAFNRIKPRHFVSGPVIVKAMLENNIKDMKFLSTFAGGGESLSIERGKESQFIFYTIKGIVGIM